MTDFRGKCAVLTGAGSGFGLECARIAARLGMNVDRAGGLPEGRSHEEQGRRRRRTRQLSAGVEHAVQWRELRQVVLQVAVG
jgi:NAD(P)-dependent dehydrogenase (short-subunit alcohol dehydrogenase family)